MSIDFIFNLRMYNFEFLKMTNINHGALILEQKKIEEWDLYRWLANFL